MARKVFVELGAVWVALTWWGRHAHQGRGMWHGSLIGLATLIVLIPVDLGHALAHIFSARYAGAPMDEVRLSGGMPRTLYWNNEVSPDVHRIRALGGLVFNLLGSLLSSVRVRCGATPNTRTRACGDISRWTCAPLRRESHASTHRGWRHTDEMDTRCTRTYGGPGRRDSAASRLDDGLRTGSRAPR